MKKAIFISLIASCMAFGQNQKYDFLDQIGLIKTLIPNIQKIGIMIGPNDYNTLIESMGAAQTQHGISVIPIKLNNVKQKLPQYVKMAATGVVKNHGINALMFIEGEDEVTKSPVGIKFTSGALNRMGIPVFSANEKAMKLGCLGQFVLKGDQWVMNVSSEVAGDLKVTIPSGDSNFISQ